MQNDTTFLAVEADVSKARLRCNKMPVSSAGVMSVANVRKSARLSSVASAMRLLKCFTDEAYELGIGALSRQLGLAKSTTHRLASTLMDAGMLEQNAETGKYRLGLTVFELGSLARRKMDLYTQAKAALKGLRESTGESVNLAILRDDCLIYLNSLESPSAIKVRSHMGMRLSPHCAAEGKVLIAFLPEDEVSRMLAGGLKAQTAQTITDPVKFTVELQEIAQRGYATNYEESEAGLRAIAAPVFGAEDEVIAAIGIAGPVQRLTKKTLLSFLPALGNAAESISARMGDTRARTSLGLRAVR
jgi:IclR family KDG regulon transcriptional repressor